MRNAFPILLLLFTLPAIPPAASGDDIRYYDHIEPILKQHCIKCHGEKVREGGLRFTSRKEAMLETDSGGVALVPGKLNKSLMISRILSHDPDEKMPPEGSRVSDVEIKTLERWITEGAQWPKKRQTHWAYLLPKRTTPQLEEGDRNLFWARNEIDEFVLLKLREKGLRNFKLNHLDDEEPARLIRRASFALTGLPPTAEQVDKFVDAPTNKNYLEFVDACLDSPRFGERWAQPWLDLARYADSNGFQADQLRESWAYRDWVINSINTDQPFDQFSIEQLAGDLIPEATLEQKIATGFHRTVPCNVEAGVHPEQNRINQVFDRVNTTGTVFLGTTIECCQCHNHKYDPFSQEEYYQLFAFFNNTSLEVKLDSGVQYNFAGPKLELPLPPELESKRQDLQKQLDVLVVEKSKLKSDFKNSREALLQQLIAKTQTPVEWQTMEISNFESTGGESHEVINDQSVLIGGSLPDTTTYRVKATSSVKSIKTIRLEVLTHESLPGTGPGRGDEKRANFILSEFEASVRNSLDKQPVFTPLKLTNPTADFSQTKWDVSKAIDGDTKTGWAVAPKFFTDHWASFEVDQPIASTNGKTEFQFSLNQNYGRGRTIGRLRFSATSSDSKVLSLPKDIKAILKLAKPNKKQSTRLSKYLQSQDPRLTKLNQKIAGLEKQLSAVAPHSTLVMVEMDERRDTFQFVRGDYLNPGKKVTPDVPDVLHPMKSSLPRNRLGLATWMFDRKNPLPARVAVNRWWTNLFGRGLVKSGEDFGTQSQPPSHPKLLDWLSLELVKQGWSRKHVIRMIVTSSTFRQSSKMSQEMLELDPDNQWLMRGPRLRMNAEMIRDNGLAVSGLLSTEMGGPPIMPFQPDNIWRAVGRNAPQWKAATSEERFRRGVYVVWRRAAPFPSFVNFDAPDRAACVVERSRTNTPLQALTLLNDQAFLEMAIALAARVLNDQPNATIESKITKAIRHCLVRDASEAEIEELTNLYEIELKNFKTSNDRVSQFFKATKKLKQFSRRTQAQPSPELAAFSLVCNVLLNLDETINY